MAIPGQALSKNEIYQSVFSQEKVNWFSAKAKVKITDNLGSQKANLYIRMKQDSVIWMSVKKYSSEGARAILTRDSLQILNRIDKTFQANSLDSISHVFGMLPNYQFIQNSVLGFLPPLDTSRLWNEKETEQYFKFRSVCDDIVLDFFVDKYSGLPSHGSFYDMSIESGTWSYSDYRKIEDIMLPFHRIFHITFDSENFIELDLQFSEIELFIPVEMKFDIPDHYIRI